MRSSIILFIIFLSLYTSGQTCYISGRVTNEKNKPVVGVVVAISASGFKTDSNGMYAGTIKKGTYNYSCKYAGYKIKNLDNVRYDSDTMVVNIELEIDSGYEARHRIDLDNLRLENEIPDSLRHVETTVYNCPRIPYLKIDPTTQREFDKNIKIHHSYAHSQTTLIIMSDIKEIALADTTGRIVYQYHVPDDKRITINLPGIAAGRYYVGYMENKKWQTGKITLSMK
jgi:hypothetical protein